MPLADAGGPVPERVVAVVCGDRQGSGYLLAPSIVLTAAHVVSGAAGPIRAVSVGGRGPQPCTVVWSGEDSGCDVALLRADEPLVAGDPHNAPWPSMHWGRILTAEPIKDCQAIGFPYAQRDATGRLESEHLIGTLKPGTGLPAGRYVLDSDHAPPVSRGDAGSAWAGFSGSALFAYGLLVGVASAAPAGWPDSRITATPVADLPERNLSFFSALKRHGCPVPEIRPAHPDAEFERRYAAYVAAKHSELTIYGVSLNHGREWPLDASYLRLEATFTHSEDERDGCPSAAGGRGDGRAPAAGGSPAAATHGSPWQQRTPLLADQALAGRDRVLLRGVAGSGKTTLVQWLAVTAAGGDVNEDMAYLRGRVPFVLPLRTLVRDGRDLPAPERFLSAVGCPIALAQPMGWADRVLSASRGLLLVDGVDEIPHPDRKRTRQWIHDLIAAYPGNLWLVTSREPAVPPDWLVREQFTDLVLAPMNREGVTAFVTRWHTATGADPSLARDALTAIRTRQDLARLATNPLMCALICALHRDRRGYLPHGRKQLYDQALSMLLENRDIDRGIAKAVGRDLTQEPQVRLLQKLAYWMVRNQQPELDRQRAKRIIEDALASVPQMAAVGNAEDVLQHLLLRSGILREPALDAIDFVHRTFQDFLAAKAAVDEGDFGLLLENASKTQWEDVIRMAVAHARPKECAAFLKDLIALGDQTGDRRIHILAMACLENVAELDAEVGKLVDDRVSRVIPPRSFEEVSALIEAGPIVLELLPGPEELTEWEAGYVLETAAGIADDAALPLLAGFCLAEWPRVRERVIDAWGSFETDRYAEEVISYFPADEVLTVRNPEQMAAVRKLGGRQRLHVRGDLSRTALAEPFPGTTHELLISANRTLTDLHFLASWAELHSLTLAGCPNITSLHGAASLPRLESFSADAFTHVPPCTEFLPRHAPLRKLSLPNAEAAPGWLHAIRDWPTVRYLELGLGNSPSQKEDWEAIRQLPELEHLTTAVNSLSCFPPRKTAAGIKHLALVGDSSSDLIFNQVARYFPNVSVLDLSAFSTFGRTPALGLSAKPPQLKLLIVRRGTDLIDQHRCPDLEIAEVG